MEVALYIYTKKTIDASVDLVVNKFKERVIADGGTFEADSCLVSEINSLGGVYGVALNTISDFANRVQTDGGTFEAENCLLNIINDLGGVEPTPTEIDYVRRIELFNDEKISITSSIQNVNDISKVFTDYSQSFTIPASDNNNEIFRHWYDNALDNGFDQRKRYSGYIEIDTQVFRVGQWQLESANVKNNRIEDYKITFYGVLTSLTEKFGEDKLKDILELNEYSISYSGAIVQDKITTTSDSNILFPLISSNRVWQYQTGGNTDIGHPSGHIHHTELFPALKIARIFDAIENKYGIIFNGNFLTQSRFTKAYLWLKNRDNFTSITGKKILNFDNQFSSDNGLITFYTDSFFYNPQNFNSPSDAYSVTCGISYTLSASTSWQIFVYKDNEFFTSTAGTGIGAFCQIPGINGNYKVYLSTSTQVNYIGTAGVLFSVYDVDNNVIIEESYNDGSNGISNAILDLPIYMPDMKVSDFFSGILKMFNLTAFSFDDNNYTLEQLENWYYQGEIKNFSEYCVTEFDYERIKPYKKVNFNYEKSDSLMNKGFRETYQREYGDLSYPFNNDGSEYSVKLPFENLYFNKFQGSTKIQVSYSLKPDLTKYIPKPVILYFYENRNTNVSFYFNDGTSTNHITNYNVLGQDVKYQNIDNTLNFGIEFSTYTQNVVENTLFQNYYFDYLNNLYSMKSRMVKVAMRLPYSELLALRLNDRIIIRDKRYIINSFTTDLDTFESKFELIQDFRTLNFNNSDVIEIENTALTFTIDTVSNKRLVWTVLNDPTGAIITITSTDDYVEISTKANFTGVAKIYSIQSDNNDLIVIKQNA